MYPFDERFVDSLGFFSANLIRRSSIAFDNQVGGYCCWLDAGEFLLEVPIEQIMEGFQGWVTGVVGELFDWVGGVLS